MRGNGGYDILTIHGGYEGNVDFSSAAFTSARLEEIDLSGYRVHSDIVHENILFIESDDINIGSTGRTLYVTGDVGLDNVSSTDFTESDRIDTTTVDGVDFAHYQEGTTDLFVQVGLDLNGVEIV